MGTSSALPSDFRDDIVACAQEFATLKPCREVPFYDPVSFIPAQWEKQAFETWHAACTDAISAAFGYRVRLYCQFGQHGRDFWRIEREIGQCSMGYRYTERPPMCGNLRWEEAFLTVAERQKQRHARREESPPGVVEHHAYYKELGGDRFDGDPCEPVTLPLTPEDDALDAECSADIPEEWRP